MNKFLKEFINIVFALPAVLLLLPVSVLMA